MSFKNNKECPNCGEKITKSNAIQSVETGLSYCSEECANIHVNKTYWETEWHEVKGGKNIPSLTEQLKKMKPIKENSVGFQRRLRDEWEEHKIKSNTFRKYFCCVCEQELELNRDGNLLDPFAIYMQCYNPKCNLYNILVARVKEEPTKSDNFINKKEDRESEALRTIDELIKKYKSMLNNRMWTAERCLCETIIKDLEVSKENGN